MAEEYNRYLLKTIRKQIKNTNEQFVFTGFHVRTIAADITVCACHWWGDQHLIICTSQPIYVHPEQSTCVLIISMKLVRNIVSTFPRWTVQHYWFSGSKLEESKALHYCCTWRNNHSEEEAENGDDHTIAVDAPILHISPAVVSCVTFHLTKCAKSCII